MPAFILADVFLTPAYWSEPSAALFPLFQPNQKLAGGRQDIFAGLSNTRLLGYIILLAGSLYRRWAMRTLGQYFTFRLTLRPGHKIIRQGPYGQVRHPSYLGYYTLGVGVFVVLETGTTMNRLFGLREAPALFVVAVAMVISHFATTVHFIAARVREEERFLAESFGDDWVEHCQLVPYRVFPLVW